MFAAYCSAFGLAGWLLMLAVWVALVALVVWAVIRLFPGRNDTAPPAASEDLSPAETPRAPVRGSRGR